MTTWKIDTSHSEVTFKVKHLVISSVTGKFKSFAGTIDTNKEDLTDARIQFSLDINSLDTGNEQRDGHLKSAEFFDAPNHPKLTFVSKEIVNEGSGDYTVHGDLTVRGITKPVSLDVEYGGIQKDIYGNTVAGFEISGKINRQEFGLTWHALTETGGLVVSDEVKLSINIEAIKQA